MGTTIGHRPRVYRGLGCPRPTGPIALAYWRRIQRFLATAMGLRRCPGFLVDRARAVGADLADAQFDPWGRAVRGADRRE